MECSTSISNCVVNSKRIYRSILQCFKKVIILLPIKKLKVEKLIQPNNSLENLVYSYFFEKYQCIPFRTNYYYLDLSIIKLHNKLKSIKKKYGLEYSIFHILENMVGDEPNVYGLKIGENIILTYQIINLKSVTDFSIYYVPEDSEEISESETLQTVSVITDLEKIIFKNLAFIEKFPSVYIITYDKGNMTARPYNLNISDKFIYEDLDLHYGEGFEEYYNNLKKEMIERDSGFILFSGVEGSGKTHTIKALARDLYTNMNFIYVPSNMISNIGQPEFLSFLSSFCDNMLGCKFVLILEDSEDILSIRDGENYNSNSISNILNLTDGILKDVYNTIIISTTSLSVDKIDSALLRSGRIISHKEFSYLDKHQYEHFKDKFKLEEDFEENKYTISNVYNKIKDNLVDSKKLDSIQKKTHNIGFNF